MGSPRVVVQQGLQFKLPESPVVVTYKAFISTQLLYSEISIASDFSSDVVRKAVLHQLDYLDGAWFTRTYADDPSLIRGALEKMLHMLSIREKATVADSESMRQLIQSRYGSVIALPNSGNYKRYECIVALNANGIVTWEFSHPGEGEYFGSLILDLQGKALDLDDYLIAQMKLDIYRRLESTS